MAKAELLGLFSGGLDSLLAARILAAQGVRFELVHFATGFVWNSRVREVERTMAQPQRSGCLKLHRLAVGEKYLRVISDADPGFGAARRCLACRAWMLGEAGRLARERGIPFLFSGEVLGQGNLGQRRTDFERMEEQKSLTGRVLRPLSAQLLPRTTVEEKGVVDRSRLGRVHGRARRTQFAMARSLGIQGPPSPSSRCCWLADPHFERRFRDRLGRGPTARAESLIERLKIGRHFRLAWNLTVIVARDEAESRRLQELSEGDLSIQVTSGRGAVALAEGRPTDSQLQDLAGIAVHYSQERNGPTTVTVRRGNEDPTEVTAVPSEPGRLRDWRI